MKIAACGSVKARCCGLSEGGRIDPDLDHTAHANGGYDAYYWKLGAQLWSENIPAYDRTARELANAEAAADQINAWQGFR